MFVTTGPLWLPEREEEGKYMMKYPMIGQPPALVAVPTHFYKVILAEPKDEPPQLDADGILGDANCAVAAFVMPNRAIPGNIPLTRFVVPISDLESATGLTFYPKFMNDEKRMQLDRAALVWRSIGRALQGKTNTQLLQTLDALEPETKKKSAASADLAKMKKKEFQPITSTFSLTKQGHSFILMPAGKNCRLEPHLCYHTECSLPPPEFWKKATESQSAPKSA